MKKLHRDVKRLARQLGYVPEISGSSNGHSKLRLWKEGRCWCLSISGSPTSEDIALRKIERDLKLYCQP